MLRVSVSRLDRGGVSRLDRGGCIAVRVWSTARSTSSIAAPCAKTQLPPVEDIQATDTPLTAKSQRHLKVSCLPFLASPEEVKDDARDIAIDTYRTNKVSLVRRLFNYIFFSHKMKMRTKMKSFTATYLPYWVSGNELSDYIYPPADFVIHTNVFRELYLPRL
jgi:hypothetical protein